MSFFKDTRVHFRQALFRPTVTGTAYDIFKHGSFPVYRRLQNYSIAFVNNTETYPRLPTVTLPDLKGNDDLTFT
jgi:hypothetical protein